MMISGDETERLLPALGQRERTTLGALAACGRIGSAELIAANRWHEEYAMAEHGVFEGAGNRPGSSTKLLAQERMVQAVSQHAKARAALGQAGHDRMTALLGSGLSIKALSVQIDRNAAVASGMVEADLVRLVEHYTAATSGSRRMH